MNNRQQQVLDRYYRKYLEEYHLKDLINKGMNFTEFVDMNYTKCALDELNKSHHCKVYDKYIETLQGTTICYTLFHMTDGLNLNQKAAKSGFSQSAVIVGDSGEVNIESSQLPTEPNEVIRFLINFGVNESTNLNEPASGSVLVHDPHTIPSGRISSTYLEPGFYYTIYMLETQTELLEAPYDTDCFNYSTHKDQYVRKKDTKPHPFFEYPLSSSDCLVGCLGAKTVNACDCWPPELPYIQHPKDQLFSKTSEMMMCNWKSRAKKAGVYHKGPDNQGALEIFTQCLGRFEKECKKNCKTECSKSRFLTHVYVREWPADERIVSNFRVTPDHEN